MKPIESAPRDGTAILVLQKWPEAFAKHLTQLPVYWVVARWRGGYWRMIPDGTKLDGIIYSLPEFWHELPPTEELKK